MTEPIKKALEGDVRPLAGSLARSARSAGARAVASGRWLAEWLVDNAPRIPVRDAATLSRQHDGKQGDELAAELVRSASLASAAVGAAVGGVAAAGVLMAAPAELAAETLAVAVIELRLVAELHEVYGRRLEGSAADQAALLLQSWADRRGVSPGGRVQPGRVVRDELLRAVRRRLIRRMARNLPTLTPLLVGAAAGAEVNRRATRALGEALSRDLRKAQDGP